MIEIRRSSISPRLYNLISSKTQDSINESCSCSKTESRHKSEEEKALEKLSKDVNLVLEKAENKSSYLIPRLVLVQKHPPEVLFEKSCS